MKASKVIPENWLRLMSPKDRKALGKAGQTQVEANARGEARSEKELQQLIIQELNRRGIVIISQRMDKRTRSKVGQPDIIFVNVGVPWAVECKTATGRLRPEQTIMLAKMEYDGWNTLVCRTFEQFKKEVFER